MIERFGDAAGYVGQPGQNAAAEYGAPSQRRPALMRNCA